MPHGRALSFAAKRQECCVSNITPPQAEKFFCPTFCTLQKVGERSRRKAAKGFNFVSAKPLLRRAESRFAKPRSSLRGRTDLFFSLVRKEWGVPQRFANLWTPGTIQSSVGSNFAKTSGGTCRNRFCPQNTGEKALNRCERVTVVQTQDRCFSKKKRCTASSQ